MGYILTKSVDRKDRVEISHTLIMQKVEALGNLEVVKYNFQDIIEYEMIRQWLPNSHTALVVVGEVIGCVDLTKVGIDDIFTSNDSIRIMLPAPEICHVKVDHSKSRIQNIEFGLWEKEKIADEAYRYAEQHLNTVAQKMDIATDSRTNTVKLLEPMFHAMGFNKVTIQFAMPNNENTNAFK